MIGKCLTGKRPKNSAASLLPIETSYTCDGTLRARALGSWAGLYHYSTATNTTILLAIGIFTYSIEDRFNKDYLDSIFVDAEINVKGQITLNCKPGFADSRTFIVTTNLKGIEEQIKKYGELYQGSYFLQNTKIKKNFRFSKLQSITLTKIGDNIISPQLTWTTKEIKGDVDFLQP